MTLLAPADAPGGVPTATRRLARAALWAVLAPVVVFRPATAQAPPGTANMGWPAPEAGVRFGYDNSQRQEVLGALLRIPVLRSGHVELTPNGDVTFLRGIKEYQFNGEAVYMVSGRDGGFYAGGGVGLRNTIPSSNLGGGRKTITTYSVVAGVKFTALGPANLIFEFRRIFASDIVVDPQLLSVGVTIRLW